MAAPSPTGPAMTIAITATIMEPASRVRRSNRPRRGNHPSAHSVDRSTLLMNSQAPPTSDSTIAALTAIESSAAAANTPRMVRSRRRRRGFPASPAASPVGAREGWVVIEVMGPSCVAVLRNGVGAGYRSTRPRRRRGLPLLRAGRLVGPGVHGLLESLSRNGDVVDLGDRGDALVTHVVVDERLDSRGLGLGLVDVDEEVTGERVAAVRDRLRGGLDVARALLGDRDQLELVLALVGEGEADPAERGVVARDALDDGVVVGRGLVVLARRRVLLALLGDAGERQLDEGVVGSGLLAGRGDRQWRLGVGAAAADLLAEGVGRVPGLEPLGLGA